MRLLIIRYDTGKIFDDYLREREEKKTISLRITGVNNYFY